MLLQVHYLHGVCGGVGRQRDIVLDASNVIFGGAGGTMWLLRVGFVLLRIAADKHKEKLLLLFASIARVDQQLLKNVRERIGAYGKVLQRSYSISTWGVYD